MSVWISVDDRLPEKMVEVLFYIETNEQIEIGVLDRDNATWRMAFRNMTYGKSVTHWMPLPEPPKE